MTKRPDLWTNPDIAGAAFRFAEMDFDTATALLNAQYLTGGTDPVELDDKIAAIPQAQNMRDLHALAGRTRALWPSEIDHDAVGPARVRPQAEAAVRSDLSIAGSLAAKAGEIVVTFKANAPVVEAMSYRGQVLLELNTAIAEGWLLRRCGFCEGLYPARRVTRGAVAYCGTRCRSMAIRAGATE